MKLNVDFSRRVVLQTGELPWAPSPVAGVERRMLERDGEEVARATSIVRFAPGAGFPDHVHDLGEEIFVLEGIFSDESGDYGPGSYIRNSPGSSHAPHSRDGCLLFVKLRHVDAADRQNVVVNTRTAGWRPGLVPGLSVMPLASFEIQHTALVRWEPGTFFNPHRHHGGEEILVLEGVFEDEHGRYPKGTWMRSPHLSLHQPYSREGCTILVKTGHLPV
ncbi:MAG TPA: cupin domain-containing protein [Gallionellaceae bacterium]|nr:cupin domain-containing protein [Gallionellaceae bacterium]